ncbi:MAG TPA: DegQ family serine endoprotease [Verrucomicrobiae bacterium]|nr:DegQ family serine endoprotease [Verrucomicrobiae bacterium]
MKAIYKHVLFPLLPLLAAGLLAFEFTPLHTLAAPASAKPEPKLIIEEAPINRDAKAPISFAPVIKKVVPSVVNIYSTTIVHERPGRSPLFNDPFFRRFFGEPDQQQALPRTRKEESLGSGVIVSPDGYILTANHVVEGAQSVKVGLPNGEREIDAKVIGTDPPTDIAVLKIEPRKNLAPVTIADSDKLEVGDMVLAIGNPFDVGQTVTMGIVSGLGRGGFGITGYEDFIQTDAAINPGNSGGALVDAEGRLIGINTAILSGSGGFQGVGFAVPVNMARYVMDRLITTGKVLRGYLGINIQEVTPDLATQFNLPEDSRGVLVGGVSPNSPAAKAGVEDGDVIIAVNGKKVRDPRNLQLVIAQTPPETRVNLQVLRGEPGHKPIEKSLTATLGQLPQEAIAAMGGSSVPSKQEQQKQDVLDGVEVTDIDAAARRELDLPRSLHGALITSVAPDSPSAEAGLRQGDVIIEINRQPVKNAEQAVKLSDSVKGNHVLLRVWSAGAGGGPGGTHYVVVQNGKGQ